MPDFTPTERYHILRDIAHWKTELEHGSGRDFSDADFREYIVELTTLSDAALYAHWQQTVGEWVASRADITVPDTHSFDDWLAEQFEQLIAGDDVAWGYVHTVYITGIEAVPTPDQTSNTAA